MGGRYAILAVAENGSVLTFARTDGGGFDFQSAVAEVVACFEDDATHGVAADATAYQIVQVQ